MRVFRKFAAAAVILAVTALTACGNQQAPAQEPAAAQETPAVQAEEQGKEPAEEPADSAEPVSAEPAAAEGSAPLTVAAVSKSIGDLWLLSGGERAGMTEDGRVIEGI